MLLQLAYFKLFKSTASLATHTRSFSIIKPSKMRLPYVTDPPNFTSESDQAIEQRIRERRGARGLIPLDKALLHSPPVADGW